MLIKTQSFILCTGIQTKHVELGKDLMLKQIFDLTGICLILIN
jgi:hypothetical protein